MQGEEPEEEEEEPPQPEDPELISRMVSLGVSRSEATKLVARLGSKEKARALRDQNFLRQLAGRTR